MDKNDIPGLIEALCDAPLDGEAEPSAALLALRREAAKALKEASLAADGHDARADGEALTAALAAVLSGSANEAARKTLAELVTRSAAARLDAESAAAFVEATEQSASTAPAHLVEELFEAEAVASPLAATPSFWSRIADGLRPARAYRIAAACSVVLLASAATWSLYWSEGGHIASPPEPMAKTDSAAPAAAPLPGTARMTTESAKTESATTDSATPDSATPAVADVPALPAAPKPSLVARQPCEPRLHAREALRTRSSRALADKKADASAAGSGCDVTPADDADAAIKQAREEAERARRNAALPATAAPSSAAIGTVQTQAAPAQADPAGTAFGGVRPAATAPAAKPATRMRELSR